MIYLTWWFLAQHVAWSKPCLLNPYPSPPIPLLTCQPINHFSCQLIDNLNPPPHTLSYYLFHFFLLPYLWHLYRMLLNHPFLPTVLPFSVSHCVGISNFRLLVPISSFSGTVLRKKRCMKVFFWYPWTLLFHPSLSTLDLMPSFLALSLSVCVIQAIKKAVLAHYQKKNRPFA